VFCWGRGDRGQLGAGSGDRSSPVQVSNITNASAVAVDHRASCALTQGAVYCWGSNHRGQLGNGAGANGVESRTPVQVTGITNATGVAMAGFGGCALFGTTASPGGASCWGYNQHGQLGNGNTTQSLVPVAVSGVSDAVALDIGGRGARNGLGCVVRSGGSVSCWGDGRHSKINGVNTNAISTPVAIAGIANATAVTVGAQHMCALINDGTVRCWGRGQLGQLGNGASPDFSGQVTVTGLSGVTQISAGGGSTCARLSSGQVHCWGANEYGQLGNPLAAGSTPTLVTGF
jgi:alpha-tubulin suppressor-like RCC1 family protein